ncbi:MAG: tRNA 2-thiouridine(34) synthase MnmA [Candidatus Pacearchaeota archaeon]
MKDKVFVLMSGGVDSSVAALLLKRADFNVVGIHLKVSNYCDVADEEDARLVAEKLGIPFYVLDISKEYQRIVTLDMIKNYALGYTPNPDVLCNKLIKFGYVYEFIKKLGAKYIATGHYAKKIEINGKHYIKIAKDLNKDQTYFLWGIKRSLIKNIIFPLGDYTKEEVRKIAKENNLPNAEKKDSQGICFLGKIKLMDFLKEFLPENKGLIIDTKNRVLGYHPGHYFFTEGQRHGLNIKTGDGPFYVAVKDPKRNLLIVAKENEEILYTKEIKVKNLNFLVDKEFIEKIKISSDEIKILVRCRYRQPLTHAILNLKNKIVKFENPIKSVAKGQSAVFYYDDILVGGGIIYDKIK